MAADLLGETERNRRMKYLEYLIWFGVPITTLLGAIIGGGLWRRGLISKPAAQTASAVLLSASVGCFCYAMYSITQDLRKRRRRTQ